MNKPVLLLCIAATVIFYSCDMKFSGTTEECEYCTDYKPDSIDIELQISLDSAHKEIPVLLYKGTIDKGEFIDTFFCFANPAYIYVKTNTKYSINAIYKFDKKTTMVIAGVNPKLRQINCADEFGSHFCWTAVKQKLDLRLNYQP